MNKKQILKKLLADYENHECKEIHLIWSDGTKAGIANKEIKDLVMSVLKQELRRQIAEC